MGGPGPVPALTSDRQRATPGGPGAHERIARTYERIPRKPRRNKVKYNLQMILYKVASLACGTLELERVSLLISLLAP